MSEKVPTDLDAALAALARAEQSARPAVSADLRARVLADAAEVAAEKSARERPAVDSPRAGNSRAGPFGWLRGLDLWAGAAVAGALLCLAIGLGVGYEAGETVLAGTGLGDDVRMAQADTADALFLSEDVL